LTTARYDGQTEWYESYASGEVFTTARECAVTLLGNGPGLCLDLGCGTGGALPLLLRAGWSVVGADVSSDQLEAARTHVGDEVRLVHADAHALPFETGEFDAVVSILTHTDFDDPRRAFTEAARVLRPGGTFVYLGVHPCFGSPFNERRDGVAVAIRPGYRAAGWHTLPPDPASSKIRARVGINHIPLAGLFNAIIESGFTISAVEEPGDADPPIFLALRASH
jgi:ubiquinone/menaquinone biosynthesis C-methylase UbiE